MKQSKISLVIVRLLLAHAPISGNHTQRDKSTIMNGIITILCNFKSLGMGQIKEGACPYSP